jgi:uncharacterized protein YqjF (DUF2071 family)
MMTRREFLELGASTATAGVLGAGCNVGVSRFVEEKAHRDRPLPSTPWVMSMRWHDLLFIHWPCRPETIRPLIPSQLELETFDGLCWIGVVPFRMSGVRSRLFPLPMAFPELNVRTYVRTKGRSGVWFFSLDATSWMAVTVARWLGLPYYHARMTVQPEGAAVNYASVRTHKGVSPAELTASYGPIGSVFHATVGSLEHWLTERYFLFGALRPDEVVYGEIHHPQWELQAAEIEFRKNTMTEPLGIELTKEKPLCHFARYQEVVAWPVVSLDRLQ